jgi:hypothetical protein
MERRTMPGPKANDCDRNHAKGAYTLAVQHGGRNYCRTIGGGNQAGGHCCCQGCPNCYRPDPFSDEGWGDDRAHGSGRP